MLVSLALPGCFDERSAARQDQDLDEEPSPSARIARVHVRVHSNADELNGQSELQVEGRFVEYRGVDEAFVRVRASLPPLATDLLLPGACVPTDNLLGDDDGAEEASDRELALADVGDMWVSVGQREFPVPLALVPDFLEYVSGVEYAYADDSSAALRPVPDGTIPVEVRVEAVAGEDVTSFGASTRLPARVDLAVEVGPNDLQVSWDDGGEGLLELDLTMLRGGEIDGQPVTCVVADDGAARISLLDLHHLGFGPGDAVQVVARRYRRSTVAAGAFESIELVAETRSHAVTPWPWLHLR
ncbi:MAG: hypothetical protein B7733_10750 [Myxococcales bacterium FL481]|nr:MAG: hypothetical protein B7733_10750 [Myxococcales bacterium FL481]